MKNTILKMAGTKDEKSFYKKYPTEAAFLKAHPKAKAELKKFATGGQMNAQAMQQFANGGVWGDIKEYAGIAAQFSDLAGIGYGEKIRRETDQEGVAFGEKFGDTMASGTQGVTKGVFNALPFGNALTGLTDQTNSAINKPEYNADGSLKQLYKGRTKIQKTAGGVGELVGAVGTGLATGNVKDATSSAMQGFGKFSEGMDTDSSGERKNSNWATASNVSNSLTPLAGMVGGQFNGSGINFNAGSKINANNMQSGFKPMSSTDNIGQTQFGVAKYGGMYNMGGIQQYAMGGFGDPTDPPISAKIINNAQKVSTVPSNYNKIGSQDNRTYYDVASDKAKSNPLGNGTGPNPGWEQSIIKRLQSGTSAQSLADAGHISSSQIEKYNQYYKPLYTETEAIKTEPIPLNTEQFNPRQETNFGQKYKTLMFPGAHGYSGNDVSYKYYDPTTNKEINQDLNKSFDPKGNFVPSFLEQQSNANNMPVITNKYGGLMQYAMGGMNVQPNAEIELTEGTKDGYSIRSHDLNSHENATEANDVFLKGGSKVLSTRLIDPDTKEPFSNSTIDTKKYEKTINDPKASPLSKETAAKMINVAGIIFDKSFAKQELLKQQMASSAFDRMVKKYGLPPQLKNAQPTQYNEQMPQGMPGQSQGEMAIGKHGGMMNYMAMGGIQESDYQTDPGNLPSLLRQKRANDAALLGIRSSFGPKDDTNNVKDNLVVTLNKAKDFQKELTNKIKNHPEFKKAMGGRFPMYQDGDVVPPQQQPFSWGNLGNSSLQVPKNPNSNPKPMFMKGYTENDGNYNQNNSVNLATGHLYGNYIKGYPDNYNPNVEDQDQMFNYDQDGNLDLNNYNIGNLGRSFPDHEYNNNPNYKFTHTGLYGDEMNTYLNDANIANSLVGSKSKIYGPLDKPGWGVRTNIDSNVNTQVNPKVNTKVNTQVDSKVDPKVDPKDKGKGFDYKKAAGNLGQYALQNAGNIYDLYRSTQDNSKLNLSRVSPTFLDKTQDLQNNLRLYSEGKRQTAEASQGNASTYLNNMYANRASKLANDLNINTTYGNLNASIDNAAKLYNAGAIDKETMFKLQAEGMNRNLKGQALAGMSQNFLNQRNSDRQDALDQQRLGLQKQYYKAFYDNQDRENQRRVDEITKGKSNSNLCIGGNCFDNTGSSNQTQSTQSTPFYFSQSQDSWNAMAKQQQAQDKLKKGKK